MELKEELKTKILILKRKPKIIFKDSLTSNQTATKLKKINKACWNIEELSTSFILVRDLRGILYYPLPGITLQHWAVNIDLRSVILHDVLKTTPISGTVKEKYHSSFLL